MKVVLSPDVIGQIRGHGEETYPHECCGFLYGEERDGVRIVRELRRQENERTDSRENRFLITPDQFRLAEKHARQIGSLMLGIYHSHPDSPPRPSAFDRDHAWPWYTYVIVTVVKGTAGEALGWQLREDRSGYDPVTLDIDAAPGSSRSTGTAAPRGKERENT